MIFVLFLSSSLTTLTASDQRLSLGIVGGMTSNSGSGEHVEKLYDSTGKQIEGALSRSVMGGNVGIFVQYRAPEYFFAIQPEVMFLFNRGLAYLDTAEEPAFKATIMGHQVAFNLLAQAIIPTSETVSFTISVGPTFTFPLTSIKQVYANSTTETADYITFSSYPVSYGILAGVGLQLELGPGFFVIDGRFQMDFTSFSPQRNIPLSTPITLQVGYAFYLWEKSE